MNPIDGNPSDRCDLTDKDVAEFRQLWNGDIIALGRDGVGERGFSLVTSPGAAHLSWPAGRKHPGKSILLTIVSVDGRWSPARRLKNATSEATGELVTIPDDAEIAAYCCVYEPGASTRMLPRTRSTIGRRARNEIH